MHTIKYTIQDENGIHARPAGIIVSAAKKYNSTITIRIERTDKSADAKKLFAVMGLGAQKGDILHITAEGEDAAEALTDIEKEMHEVEL